MELVDDVAAAVFASTKRAFPNAVFTAKKLEKLAYYCQSWSLVTRDEVMFQDAIEAWAEGPMIRHLFEQHRGRRVIHSWPSGRADRLSEESWKIVHWVVTHYGQFTAEQLGDMTHREAPWRKARRDVPVGKRSDQPIDLADMREFYAALLVDGTAAADFAIAVSALEGIRFDDEVTALLHDVASQRLDPNEAVRRRIAASLG